MPTYYDAIDQLRNACFNACRPDLADLTEMLFICECYTAPFLIIQAFESFIRRDESIMPVDAESMTDDLITIRTILDGIPVDVFNLGF
jgi:hypothetical protein